MNIPTQAFTSATGTQYQYGAFDVTLRTVDSHGRVRVCTHIFIAHEREGMEFFILGMPWLQQKVSL
jgi:hypothetical protein